MNPLAKLTGLWLIPVLWLNTACEYKVPLTTEHVIPVDTAVLGHWDYVPGPDENADDTHIRIMRFSDTEYLVHYFEDDGELYVRAYLARIEDLELVQLELIGDDDGPTEVDEEELYNVARYHLEDGQLKISLLNSELVDDDIGDSALLVSALLTHRDHPELFGTPGTFKRRPD